MKKHRQGKKTRKSFRIPELLLVFLMITAMVIPMGVKASETADGSASGASQAVAEEKPEKQKEKESSSASTAVKEESTKSASSSDESAGSSATERKEQKGETSGNSVSAGTDSAGGDKTGSNDAAGGKSTQDKNTSSDANTKDASDSSTDSSTDKTDKNEEESGRAASVKADGDDDSQSSSSGDEGSGTSKTESDRNNEEDNDAAAGDSDQNKAAETAAGDSDQNKADGSGTDQNGTSDNDDDKNNNKNNEAGDGTGQETENAAEEMTAANETDETTITFEAKEVTVIADKAAFDGDVTMKVKKVTDPEQMLKMIMTLQDKGKGEGASYTVKAYTVSFYDEDGKEVEPKIPVQVNVNTKVSSPSKSKVVHVKDDDKTEVVDADIDRSGASFELDSFSDIGVATEQSVKIPGSSFDLYLGDELTTEYIVGDLPAGPIKEEYIPTVEGYSYKNASVDGELVEEIGSITDDEGNVYVYYTSKNEDGTIKAQILGDGRIRINLVETDQDTSYDLDAGGAHVHIDAPAGAFDKGTYMEIRTAALTPEQQSLVKEQAAEVLGQDAVMDIQAVDITFYDEEGKKVQPRGTVQVELTTPEAVQGDFCVVHLGDTADRIDAQRSEDGKIQFNANEFSVYAVIDQGDDDEVPRIFYNFIVINGESGAEETVNTQIVKDGDTLYDPGFPGFSEHGYSDAKSEFLGWYYTEDGTETGPITFGGTVSTDGMTEDKTINAYAKIRTTYYVTFKGQSGEVVQVKKIVVETNETETVDASGVSYTPTSEYVCIGWSTDQNASEAEITEDTSVTVTGNMTFYPVLKEANWIHFDENDGGAGGGASYTGPVYCRIDEDLSTKKPADPTRAGYTFGGWYLEPECTNAFTWSGKLEDRTDLVDHEITIYAKWTPTGDTPYTIAYWQQNANDDDYTLTEIEVVENNNAGDTTAVASITGIADKYASDHFVLNTTTNPIVEQTISNSGDTVVNVYYDREVFELRFYFARSFTANGHDYLQVNNNNEGFNWHSTSTPEEALSYTTANQVDYGRYSGINTWRDVDADSAEALVSSSYLSANNITIGQTDIDNVRTWLVDANGGTANNSSRQDMTYYYIPLTVKYGQSLTSIWPDAAIFPTATMTEYNCDYYLVGNRYQRNTGIRYDPIYPLLWGSRKEGTNISGLKETADESLVLDGDNNIGYFLLYWRFETSYKYLYRVYFSALSDETGDYVEQTDKNFVVSNGEPYNTNSNSFADVSTINFTGTTVNHRTDTNNTDGTLNGTAYTGTIAVYYDRNIWNLIFHTNVDTGDTVTTDGTAAAYTANQTISNVPYGDKLSLYKDTPDEYVVDQTIRTANDGTIYTFKGWYVNEAFTGDPYDFSDTSNTMPDNSLNFYAKWEKQRAQVTLEPNGGTLLNGQVASFKIDFGETISKSSLEKNVSREDYTLVGWYEVIDGAVSSEPYSYGKVTKDVTLRARWRKDGTISIKYESNGMEVDGTTISGTTPPKDEAGYSSDSAVVVAAAPTNIPTGFQFIGWNLGGTTYYPNNSFDISDDLIDANDTITLTAVYQKLGADDSSTAVTSITFNANGGTGEDYLVDKSETDPSKDLRVNEVITAPTVTTAGFSREGYKFLGWDADKNATTPTYTAGEQIAADNKTGSGWDETLQKNILYAIWQKTYTVTIKKVVAPETTTDTTSFGFADPGFNPAIEGTAYTGTFSLVNGGEKVYTEVPVGTTFTVNETANDAYDVTVKYTIENAEDSTKDVTDQDSSNNASFTVYGDITVTVTNTRKYAVLKVDKTVANGTSVDLSKDFSFTWKAENGNTTAAQGNLTLQDSTDPAEIQVPVGSKLTVTETTDADWHYDTVSEMGNVSGTDEFVLETVSADMDGSTITFTNTRKAGNVTVTKNVAGNMGETDKEFSFTASLKDGSTSLKLSETSGVITIDETNGSESINFTLSHEETMQFQSLPEGTVLTIEEDEYGEYTQKCKIGTGADQESRSAEVTIESDETNVVFTNTKTAVAPTQLYSGTGPMAVLVVFSLGALLLLAAHHFIDRFRNNHNNL